MTVRSTVPSAKAGLVALLKARPALGPIQIEWAHPGQRIEHEAIFLGRVELDETPKAMGQQRRRESYRLDVVVNVEFEGDEPEACELRLWDLVAEVEDAVATDPTLGNAVLVASVSAIHQTTVGGDQRRESEAVVQVTCTANK